MLICFVGDVHGRIFHAIAAVATLQAKLGKRFDLIIQVGDLGFPDNDRADEPTKRYLAVDPAEGELALLATADGARAEALRRARHLFMGPLHFVRGNHEDFEWLASLSIDADSHTAAADHLDLLRYVPDGTVLEFDDLRVAFLGGVEELPGAPAIDRGSYESLLAMPPGAIDLLITHEGPYGTSTGYRGDVLGSRLISALLETLQPRYHIFGHAHCPIGPQPFGPTTLLGLDALVASRLWHPEQGGLKPGCLAVLDTTSDELRPVTDGWLAAFPTPFDFDAWWDQALLRSS